MSAYTFMVIGERPCLIGRSRCRRPPGCCELLHEPRRTTEEEVARRNVPKGSLDEFTVHVVEPGQATTPISHVIKSIEIEAETLD
jgi:hypothetical protein